MKLIIANLMFEPHVKALGLRWDDHREGLLSTDPFYNLSIMDGGSIHEDDLDAWHDAFNDLDFQDLFLCGDEDGKTFFLISDDDYELLENFLGQFDMIHGDNDVVTGLPYPDQLSFDCGPEDVEAFLKENCTSPDARDSWPIGAVGTWEYCFDDREKELLEWALETSRDQTLKKAPRRAEYTTETPLAFDEVNLLLKKITER